jgi:uncharacterized protein (TIGR03067 family)
MRYSRVALLLVLFPLLSAGDEKKTPPDGWKEFIPKNKDYIAWFPEDGRMRESEDSIMVKKAGQVKITRAVFERKDGTLFITSEVLLPPALAMGQPKVRQDFLRDICLDEFDGKLVSEKQVKLGVMTGREYLIKTPKGMVRFRLLGTGVLFYRQLVAGTQEQVEAKDTDIFLDSFVRTDRFIKMGEPKKEEPRTEEPRKEAPRDTGTKAQLIKKDLEKLQGRWQKLKQEASGNDSGDQSKAEAVVMGTTFIHLFNGNPNSRADIVIDPTAEPKAINVRYTAGPAGTSYGIYRFLEDGTLEICVNQPTNKPDDPRPTEFTTKLGTKGAGSTLWVFKKEEPKTEEPKKEAPRDTGTKAQLIKKDLEKLQGRWQKVKQESGGNDSGDQSKAEAVVMGSTFINLFNGNPNTRADIVIDPSAEPKAINIRYTAGPAGTSYGIYRFLEDGTLEICLNQATNKPDAPRPTEFTTKLGTKGAGSILWVFKKEK